jgi:hypothetical protein
VRLQRLAAFVECDGVFKIDLALLQARDDRFQFLQRGLEGQFLDRDWLGGRNDKSPTA